MLDAHCLYSTKGADDIIVIDVTMHSW